MVCGVGWFSDYNGGMELNSNIDRPASDLPAPELPAIDLPAISMRVRRAAARLCLLHGWAPVHEVPLPNGRRADILALAGDGRLHCIEVKSGPRDYLTDHKWPEYLDYADALYFAVDSTFPRTLLPDAAGWIVSHGLEAEIVRDAPVQTLAPARRRAMTLRLARLAAMRLAVLDDPANAVAVRAALLVE